MESPISLTSSIDHEENNNDNGFNIRKDAKPFLPLLNTSVSLQIPEIHSASITLTSPSTPKEISRTGGERNVRERPSPRRAFSFVWKNHSLNNSTASNESSPSSLSHTPQKPNDSQLFDDREIKKVITMSLQLTEEVKRLKTSLSGRELQNQILEKENQFLHDELAAFKEKVSALESKSNKLKYQRDRYHGQLSSLSEKYEAIKIRASSLQASIIGDKEYVSDEEENSSGNTSAESSITEEDSGIKPPYSNNNAKPKEKGWITTAELKNNYHSVCDKVDELSVKLERSEKSLKESLQQNKLLEIQLENARANEKALLHKFEQMEQLYFESCEKLEAVKSSKKDSISFRLDDTNHTTENETIHNSSSEDVISTHEDENENTDWPSVDALSDHIGLMSTEIFEGEEQSVFLEKENQRLRAQIEELQRILDHTRDDLQLLRIQSTLSSPRTPRLSTPREFERPSSDRSNQSESVDSKIMDEWTKLLADKFDHNLQILKEQVVKYEKRAHAMNSSHDRSYESSSSLLEDYFRLTLLSVKILLSKEPRYQNTVWYKIWCDIDSEEIYSYMLSNEIPIEEWWLFLFTTVQTRLEHAKLEYEEEEERDSEK
ncbi:hypothetical protein C9374_007484 [Naegleria lovaniensis]|uniref:Uncharacterized protein n=1 Tax=Naegleria lovaniensis TaxID=51637 RepID=A0AA88KH98_NAELO|nr:uncharacterized protein C9374_007484 [Naegleria lovaniensis]KAG2379345.1 hypothetical protein C9374_007484 [Naegleria lovaniensis]